MRSFIFAVVAIAAAITLTQLACTSSTMATTPSAEAPAPEAAKCKTTKFKTALVKSACAKGLKAAVSAMKGFVKKAKAASGEKVKCKTCHSGLKKDGYPLKPDGMALFKKYNAAIKGAKVTPHLSTSQRALVEAWLR